MFARQLLLKSLAALVTRAEVEVELSVIVHFTYRPALHLTVQTLKVVAAT